MGRASEFMDAARKSRAEREAEDLTIEMGGLMRDRGTGLFALLESLAEHPELGIRDLVSLALWRLDNGLDRDGLVDPSSRRPCSGCLTLVPIEDLKVSWYRAGEDPENGQKVSEKVTPSPIPGKAGSIVSLSGLLEAGTADAAGRMARASYQFFHPSMVSDLDPSSRLLTLPLLDVEDDGALNRFVKMTSSVDLGSLSEAADWAFSRRYGLSGDRDEMYEAALESPLAALDHRELALRIEVAAEQLRGVVAIADRSLDESPRPLGEPRLASEWRKRRGDMGRADGRQDDKKPHRRAAAVGESAKGGAGADKGNDAKGDAPRPPQVAASTTEVFAQVDGALKKREKSQAGYFGLG